MGTLRGGKNPKGGRQAGVVEERTREIREVVDSCFRQLGGGSRLRQWCEKSDDNLRDFYVLIWGKTIPKNVEIQGGLTLAKILTEISYDAHGSPGLGEGMGPGIGNSGAAAATATPVGGLIEGKIVSGGVTESREKEEVAAAGAGAGAEVASTSAEVTSPEMEAGETESGSAGPTRTRMTLEERRNRREIRRETRNTLETLAKESHPNRDMGE